MKPKTNQSKTLLTLFILTLVFSLAACSKSNKNDNDKISETNTMTKDEIQEDPATTTTIDDASIVVENVEEETIEEENIDEANPKDISIKYIGNSCFYITFTDGTKLVTDPYGSTFASSFGTFPELEADVMTISHSHSDHTSGIKAITGEPLIIRPSQLNETFTVGDVTVTGYASKHVANLGDSTIFIYEENGYKIVHMGETDIIDSVEAQEAVKDADVILAYAGEYGDILNKDNFKSLIDLNIKVIIPQHYSMNEQRRFYNQPIIEEILTSIPEGTIVNTMSELFVTKDLEKQFVVLTREETE